MNSKEVFDKYILDKEKLLDYGFKFNNNLYEYKVDINNSLYAFFRIDENNFYIKVYEKDGDEEYLPFNIKDSVGSYVSDIKESVDKVKEDIINKCFQQNDIRDELFKYLKEKYNSEPEYLWEKTPNCCIFRVNNNSKWYAAIMDVPYKSLGIDKEGVIDIINLKNTPERVIEVIDNKNYLKGYHMNKKYWFTVLINNELNLDEICHLIDESYDIVNNK